MNKELNNKYLEEMKVCTGPWDHNDADDILCALLTDLGYQEIVELFYKLEKWYS